MTHLHLARSGLLFLASCLAFGVYLGAPPLVRSESTAPEGNRAEDRARSPRA